MHSWTEYHKATSGRKPRKLLLEALPFLPAAQKVLDLGAGDLVDSKYLLDNGYEVTAVDSSHSSFTISESIKTPGFSFYQSRIEDFQFSPATYNLVTAQFALPFCDRGSLPIVMNNIRNTLKHEGIFVGNFFGINDEWNTPSSELNFIDAAELQNLFVDFQLLMSREVEKDANTAAGILKHWHLFEIIAKRTS